MDIKEKEMLTKAMAGLGAIEAKIAPLVEHQTKASSQKAAELAALETKHDALSLEIKEMQKTVEALEVKAGRQGVTERKGSKLLSSTFLQSNKFQHMLEQKNFNCENVALGSLSNYRGWETKSVSGNDQLRNVMSLDLLQGYIADPLRPNRVRDLFPVFPTRFALIEYVKESVLNINAAMTAEGLQKPESNISFIDASTAVRTLPTWIGVPRQLLEDINSLQPYLESRLMMGLKMVEDTQILYGSGTSQDLTGILTNADIQKYSWSAGTHGDTQLDAIRRGITYAQKAYYPVDGIVMSPTNWEQIELTKSTEGLYVWVNVSTGATPALWKVPVVTTTAINDGDVLLGAFGMGAAIWDREEANMRVSEHHADFFTKNMVAMLIEERIALTVFRPKSFVKVTLDMAPA